MPKIVSPDLSEFNSYTKYDLFDIPNIEAMDPKESSGMNELIRVTIEKQSEVVNKQTEMINKQSETINHLSSLVGFQQKMIEDGIKDSIETRVYSIISIVLAIIAILISVVLR
ncbi:hypothetical protein MGH68_07170 [Erysipelothrix sp. D19-032]